MKYILLAVFAVTFLVPGTTQAHGATMNLEGIADGPSTMLYLEEQALGSELHEEMEKLMESMLAGNLTQEQAVRMTELMNEYPGPHAVMMNRLGGLSSINGGWGMMSFGPGAGWGTAWAWLMLFGLVVWVVVGILTAVWLSKTISKR